MPEPGCRAAQFLPEEGALACPAGGSVGPWLVPASAVGLCSERDPKRHEAAAAAPSQGGSEGGGLILEPGVPSRAGGNKAAPFTLIPQGDLVWGRRTQKEDQRAPPALRQTWKGRGAGAVMLGSKGGAYSVSLGSSVVGIQCRHTRGSSLGHQVDAPQFINAGLAA